MATTSHFLKIFNDPIYGFISIADPFIFEVVEHPVFQRLRRIQQMGLSTLVYPGAQHTRFHHALGCLHLMQKAIQTLRIKGVIFSQEEEQGLLLSILLHDIGHGPFSHALEGFFVPNILHENMSLAIMKNLNEHFNGKLSLAIEIFENRYSRKFFYQLLSSQLDMDRLDYLNRDSFYTGVVEGSINSDRLIAMLQVHNDTLVMEEKGIYSVEKFLMSRRFMYWQVYLHKTGLVAEKVLQKVLERAKELVQKEVELKVSSSLNYFLHLNSSSDNNKHLQHFLQLDDYDVWYALKEWQNHNDIVLSTLSASILNRKLPKIILSDKPYLLQFLDETKLRIKNQLQINDDLLHYFVLVGSVKNITYHPQHSAINILLKNGEVKEWLSVGGHFNSDNFTQTVEKYFMAFPKFAVNH